MTSPLTTEELARLEATLLPGLERHYLRLLAHSLRTLQQIDPGTDGLPGTEAMQRWALAQPQLLGEEDFIKPLLEQLQQAGDMLTAIAAARSEPVAPLSLDLEDLIAWARSQARQRLNSG